MKNGQALKEKGKQTAFTEKELAGISMENLIKVIRAQGRLVDESANEEKMGEKFVKAKALVKKFQTKAKPAVGVGGGSSSECHKWSSTAGWGASQSRP